MFAMIEIVFDEGGRGGWDGMGWWENRNSGNSGRVRKK